MPRTTFYGSTDVQVTIQPNIGLDASSRQSVIEILHLLLADEVVLALKTQHADGTTRGGILPELNELYEVQYKQINANSDEIVERIHILGGSQLSGSEELIESARLGGDLQAVPGIVNILADQEAFIRFLREDARKCSELYEDQGTYALLINVMLTHEKMAWILRSHVASGQFYGERIGETNEKGSRFMD